MSRPATISFERPAPSPRLFRKNNKHIDDLLERIAVVAARANYRAVACRVRSYSADASAAGAGIAAAALLPCNP